MKSKRVSLIKNFLFVIAGSTACWGAEAGNVQTPMPNQTGRNSVDYLKIVRSYADTMIKHGRDVYCWDKTPLFAAALDRKSMKLVGKVEKIQGIRNGDRVLKGANPMHNVYLHIAVDRSQRALQNKVVTTKLLGKAMVPGLPYVNHDDTPLKVDTDYFGKKRSDKNPTAGPFENPGEGRLSLKVWPVGQK